MHLQYGTGFEQPPLPKILIFITLCVIEVALVSQAELKPGTYNIQEECAEKYRRVVNGLQRGREGEEETTIWGRLGGEVDTVKQHQWLLETQIIGCVLSKHAA